MEAKQSQIDLKASLKNIDLAGGKVHRNPFLNFLRDFRKSHKNKIDVVEITKRAAQLWRIMNERERSPYINMSRLAPKRKRNEKSKFSGQKGRKPRVKKGSKLKRDSKAVKKIDINNKISALPKRRKCVCGRYVKFL